MITEALAQNPIWTSYQVTVCVCVSVCIFEMEVLRTWQYNRLTALLSPQIKGYIQEEDLKREK